MHNPHYTHHISYLRYNSFLEMDVLVEYRTTRCALPIRLKAIKAIAVEEGIVEGSLKVIEL